MTRVQRTVAEEMEHAGFGQPRPRPDLERFEITTISAGVNTPVRVTVRDIETGATATAEHLSRYLAQEKAIQMLDAQEVA